VVHKTRTGKVVEYRRGPYYLYIINWGENRIEIEILKSEDKLVWSSRDPKKIPLARQKLVELSEGPTKTYDKVGQQPFTLDDSDLGDDCEVRQGTATEMVRGDYFLTILDFEYGEPIIDIHRVENTPIFYDYDHGGVEAAKRLIDSIPMTPFRELIEMQLENASGESETEER